jgi:hypothetical protein
MSCGTVASPNRTASGFFRDMLKDSTFTSSIDNPVKLEAHPDDVNILLTIIAGHPCQARKRFSDWDTSKSLYLLMQKYQLDRLQPWFSMFAGDYAREAPFEALILACNNPCFDEILARNAILYGIGDENADFLFDPAYFIQDFRLGKGRRYSQRPLVEPMQHPHPAQP